MKHIGWIAAGAVAFLPIVHAEECTFNGFNDGPLHGQQGWWVDRKDAAMGNFMVIDHLGITQTMGDKALVISGSDHFMKVYRNKNAVTWKPGDTAVFEMDFQIGLNGGHIDKTKNGIAMLFGGPKFKTENRWVIGIGINPDGKWMIRGSAPHWENLPPLPAETFVSRPPEGSSAVSPWYHLKFTTVKDQTRGVFRSTLQITDFDGKTVVKHNFKTDPLEGEKSTLWDTETLNVAFSAKDDINGLVCVDNVNLTSIKGDRKVTGLKDLLNP
ncbi:hypothetical protein [Pontiella agarivorans]|uniref:3-keto-disaccharide hydrolase domain-containing protein n=1 Tax=Pontiella agarivorans TaxID=3038953 RepID=A0ABU5MXR6_9BACT|nr:hypothetical protein [Pontiella agarivorans]MDZ8118876.1 hypothetical protein [Pontiella agarivorans]